MDERRTADLHKVLARIREGSVSLEGIVFILTAISGVIGLSLSSIACNVLMLILIRYLLQSNRSAQDLNHSHRISHIVRHLEDNHDRDDLRNFLVQFKASHLTLKLNPQNHTHRDSTRWINSLIAKLWPMGEIEAAEVLHQMGVSRRGQGIPVGGFRAFVDHFALGRRPPAISRITVGDKKQTLKDEVSIDMSLKYYGNCNVSFTHPIAGMTAFKVGLKNMRFVGDARIVLRPLVDQIPLIGGVVFCFLSTPDIDFDGTSLLNLIDNRLIKNAIDNVVTGLMVRPNKLYVTLTEKESLKRKIILPDPLGICYLSVIRGRHLQTPRTTFCNKATVDPAVLIRICDSFFKTETKKDNPNPWWFFTRSVPFSELMESVSLKVFDRIPRDKEDFIGKVKIPIQNFFDDEELNGSKVWAKISDKPLSSLQLRLACLSVRRDQHTLTETVAQRDRLPQGFPVAVVSVFIHSLRTYPGIQVKGEAVPFIQFRHGRLSHTTGVFGPKQNDFPRKINDGCHFVVSDHPGKDLLHILAVDGHKAGPSSSNKDHTYRPEQIIASRTLDLNGIMEADDMAKELSFSLYRGNLPVIKISMFVGIAAVALTPKLIHNLGSDRSLTCKPLFD